MNTCPSLYKGTHLTIFKKKSYHELLYTIKEEKPYKFKYISKWLVDVPPEHVDEYGHGMTTIAELFGGAESLKNKFRKGYTYGSGALFVVHKEQILRHSKEFWLELYSHFNPSAGYGLEKLWRLLFE